MLGVIRYHLHNLKNVKNTHEEVLLLAKTLASAKKVLTNKSK